MSGDAKGQTKKKNEPKVQRKQRNMRTPINLPAEKKLEKENVPEKQTLPEPCPEFYEGLKRETDEIVKIVEENNAKYNKKVILSNWKKYEAPIESYEEREEVENMGADFENLVNAPLSGGGHFQFKHEKSWDTAPESNQFGKYFNINMTNLAISLTTIPFYERNELDLNLFTESDIISMNYKANKFKQKYQQSDKSEKQKDYLDPCDILEEKLKECLVSNAENAVSSKIPKSETSQKCVIDLDFNQDSDNNELILDNISKNKSKLNDINDIAKERNKLKDPSEGIITDEEDLEEWLDDFLSK